MVHGPTFKGSTNIASIFPDRIHADPCNFTITDVKKLDAGIWFHRKFRGEKVPTLQETLSLMKSHPSQKKSKLMFDVRPVPAGHPFFGLEQKIILDIIAENKFGDRFIWLQVREFKTPIDRPRAELLRAKLPGVTLISGWELAKFEDVQERTIDAVNFEFDRPNSFIRTLTPHRGGVVYLVNSRWLFDQMWILGTSHILTPLTPLVSSCASNWAILGCRSKFLSSFLSPQPKFPSVLLSLVLTFLFRHVGSYHQSSSFLS